MDAPVISSVTPSSAKTAGGVMARILGLNFQQDFPVPLLTGPAPKPPAPVRVTFGGVASRTAYALSPTELRALVPPGLAGAVDVVVTNLAPDGTAVPGESGRLAGAFTYVAPDLSIKTLTLTRAVRALLQLLKSQVLANVVMTTAVDFDDTTGDLRNITALAKLPAMALSGPTLVENRYYSRNAFRELTDPFTGTVTKLPVSNTSDVKFTYVLVSDSMVEMTVLETLVVDFFTRNIYLYLDVDPADSTKGQVRYEMTSTFEGGPVPQNAPNESNVRQSTGLILVRALDIEAEEPTAATLTAPVGTVIDPILGPRAHLDLDIEPIGSPS